MGRERESLFGKKKAGRKKRSEEIREERETQWLIICEGKKTEPNYFRGFLNDLKARGIADLDVRIEGTGLNTVGLVNRAENYFDIVDKICGKVRVPYLDEKIIFVFDRDGFSEKNFNDAVKIAEGRYPGCTVAWSNESFELWLCLHFDYIDTPQHRDWYNDRLTDIFREKGVFTKKQSYDSDGKNDEELFEKIMLCGGDLNKAIKRADKLIDGKRLNNPAKCNPATMIFRAINVLMKEANQKS